MNSYHCLMEFGLQQAAAPDFDVLVVGATPGGLMAAVAASRTYNNLTKRNLTIGVFAEQDHVGGMCSGGLGKTDTGRTDVIGGLALEVFTRNGAVYGQPVQFDFEPHVAEHIFLTMLQEAGVTVRYRSPLASVKVRELSVSRVLTSDGMTHVRGRSGRGQLSLP